MHSFRLWLAIGLLTFSSCYEEVVGCLDPDANNYALGADEACPDCCTYPALSVRISTVWGDAPIEVGGTYADVKKDSFQLVDFRYYLGDLRLQSSAIELPEPFRPVELEEYVGGNVREVTLNGNYLLASATRRSTTVGGVRIGEVPLTGISGTYGLAERYRNVVPATAPSSDALRTQPRRLNYRDGRGYVQSRLEFTRTRGGDTISVSAYGSVPFELPFGDAVRPARGADILLDLEADLQQLLGDLDLSADTATIAEGLSQPVDFLRATAITY
ncbi:MbnP family protein [Lewinella sp. IMCC34191]|uniref:MbnP family protein n=1 Tax=Lewinella sp. IMCC34191 TaxID=2259172 RepID=UPI000E23555F|nr:MbnP family protein [Lewinella sp. IMCC34191]